MPRPRLLAVPVLAVFAALAMTGGARGAGPAADEADPARVQMRLTADEFAQGDPHAPLTIVEFTDYQCPYCRAFEAETWPRLKHDYVDTGKVRFIVRDLPLDFHAAARPAAEAAHCAGEQHKFWPMHDALLGGPADITQPGAIERRARAAGLDLAKLKACIASGKYAFIVARNAAEADALGLNGTPSFIIGRAQGSLLTGERISGAQPFEEFDSYLRELLASR